MVTKHVLDNGLRIYFIQDKTKQSASVCLAVNYPSQLNQFIVNDKTYYIEDGMAHFLEHYIIEQNDYGNYINKLNKKSIICNGYTGNDSTYYVFTAYNYFTYALKTLIKSIHNVKFNNKKVEETKKAIFQEIRRSNDNHNQLTNTIINKNIFHNLKYQSTLGTLNNIENLTYQKAEFCYNTFYNPQNEILIISGKFNEEKTLNIIKECYQDIKNKNTFKLLKITEPNEVAIKYEDIPFEIERNYTTISFKINISSLSHQEKEITYDYIAHLYSMKFSADSGIKNIYSEPIYYDLSYIHQDFFVLSLSSYNDNPKKFTDLIIKEINNYDYNKNLFDLLQKEIYLDFIYVYDYLESINMSLKSNIIKFNNENLTTKEYLEIFKDYDKFKNTIKKLDFTNYSIVNISKKTL